VTYATEFDLDGMADELAYAFAIFVSLLALVEVIQSVTSSSEPPQHRAEQSVTLHEDALQRLENGETVTVQRWHGNDLQLAGRQVIDVTEFEDKSEGE
jgi:hypothetical protein